MSLLQYVNPEKVVGFLQRTSPTSASGRTPMQAWQQFLAGQTGASGSITDLERAWLRDEGASGETLRDLWGNYLSMKGFNNGSFQDRVRAFVDSSGSVITYTLLLEDETRLLLENASDTLLLE